MTNAEKLREAAEFLKTVAHPARLTILGRLEEGVLCVSEMGDLLGAAQPYVSQHLAVLRRSGVIDCYVDGKQRCYFIKDPRVLDILSVLKPKKRGPLPPPSCCPSGGNVANEKKPKRKPAQSAGSGPRR